MKTLRLQVTMREVVPTVVRVLDVPATLTVAELHDVLQAALGWTDSHLHQFIAGDRVVGVPDEDYAPETVDETTVKLRDLPVTFTYEYDFGDSWDHEVLVLGPGDAEPGLRSGHGACPPEDCGGAGGYAELQAVLADPADPEHQHMLDWSGGGLRPFDFDRAAARVRDTFGAVPGSVRLLLDLVGSGPGGGTRLTPGGRLPRSVVRAMQDARPEWKRFGGLASVEDDLFPLVVLHDLLRVAGLLRLSRGVLTPTRAAGDDVEIVRRLRTQFDAGDFHTRLTEVAVAWLATTEGPLPRAKLAEQVFPELGHGWAAGGRPLTARDVADAIARARHEWVALDLAVSNRDELSPGPSARSLLTGATTLAYYWDTLPESQVRIRRP